MTIHSHRGPSRTRTYCSWAAMKQRCLNSHHKFFPFYGGAGITICSRWMQFENFLADMGPRPHGKTLDRLDGAKGYEPGNCRWATVRQQNKNRNFRRRVA